MGLHLRALSAIGQALDEAEARPMPDVSAILEFFEIASGDAFDVAPEQAVRFFQAKGLQPSFSYADMMDEAHAHAFTIAKMMDVDMLGQIRASLDSAAANGITFREWSKSITPVLQSGGWWGRKTVVDPITGQQVVAQLGSPWRLETIFRTNMQSAYAAGAWQEIEAQADLAPFLMYDAVDDLRTRPLHASWDRKVLPVSAKWWATHYPPNGYNCRCGVIQLDAEQVRALGLQVDQFPPSDGTFLWTNPRTGVAQAVPKGIDPGFATNAGQTFAADAKALLQQKIAAATASQAAAAKQALAKMASDLADEATAAQKAAAAAASKAALERAQAVAKDKAAQFEAAAQLEAIGKAKTAGSGLGALKAQALKKLQAGDDWPELKPTAQLAQVDDLAKVLKAKHDQSKALSTYKTAVLAGKNPPPAAAKAFKALEPAEAEAFLAKIEAEAAAIAAKKAAAEAQAAAEAGAKAESKAAAIVEGTPPDPGTMVVIGRKTKGGTEGALYQDTATGQKWLVKFNGSEDAVRNEVLASKLYGLAGVEAPELHAITIGGRPALASKIIDGIVEVDAKTLASTPSVTEAFAVDAWLANWDVAGLSFDNVVLVQGRAMRIDVGGSLRYRAVGGLKGQAFGRTVGEITSLRDGTNAQARAVFGGMSADELERSAEKVLAIADDDIRAVVMRYGPPDLAERERLADLMVARKADLARQFPEAAQRVASRQDRPAPGAPAARVTASEQEFVEASRVNGYGFATDSDQIEDNMVLVHAYRTKAGAEATRGFFKLLPGASRELLERAKAAGGERPSVDLTQARQAILDAVKSINFRASKGQPLDAKVVARIEHAQTVVRAALAQLNEASRSPSDLDRLLEVSDVLDEWLGKLVAALPDARAGKNATMLAGTFDTAAIPDALEYGAASQVSGIRWQRVAGSFSYNTANFDRSFATENGGKAGVDGANLRYEATLPDGTRVTYFPHDPSVAWAMQGVVQIDTVGKSAEATARIFSTMDEAGIKSVRAGELDRQHLYLNAFARLRLIRDSKARLAFAEIEGRDEGALRAKLALLKRETGVEVEKTQGWKTVDGVRQAFGHGRAYQQRPDLDGADFRAFERTHYLFHNPQGLGSNAGAGVFERLKVVIDGGGMFAPLVDRVRRGVPLAGSSVSSDLASGGGDYHFTRIAARSNKGYGTGVYWRASRLKRMDAITYDGDNFGRTTPGHMEENRLGQTAADFERAAMSGRNETIFKGGLSVFDEVEAIVLASAAEVKDAIAWMQSRGYRQWPDGRELSEVIITKEKHHAKP